MNPLAPLSTFLEKLNLALLLLPQVTGTNLNKVENIYDKYYHSIKAHTLDAHYVYQLKPFLSDFYKQISISYKFEIIFNA